MTYTVLSGTLNLTQPNPLTAVSSTVLEIELFSHQILKVNNFVSK